MQLDWRALQYFHTLAQTGTLVAAAEKLGISTNTLRSNLQSLEQRFGGKLFDRTHRGIVLTENGNELITATQAVSQIINDLPTATSGGTASTTYCRITCSEVVYRTLMPTVLGKLFSEFAELDLQFTPSDQILNLNDDEVDISIRHVRPSQKTFIANKVGALEFGIYGPSGGLPMDKLVSLPLVLTLRDSTMIERLLPEHRQLMNLFAQRVTVPSHGFTAALMETGQYVGVMANHAAEGVSSVAKIDLGLNFPELEIWICRKRSSSAPPSIGKVYGKLRKALTSLLELSGQD